MHTFWVSAWRCLRYGAVEDGWQGGWAWLPLRPWGLSPTETVPLQNRVIAQDKSVTPSGSESL